MIVDDLRAEAFQLGFTAFGVTRPAVPIHLDVFDDWVEKGCHAGMDYLAGERAHRLRAHPEELFPNCKAIVVLGIPYPSPLRNQYPIGTGLTGRVAAYAWGEDYHQTIPALLTQLAEKMKFILNRPFSWKGFTDSAPILERDLAQAAGLGWIGKNSCLICPGQGSFIFLAEMFLDIEIPVTAPFQADFCGKCQRCIRACPTGCILPNRTIDAARCISYLTIENKGSIPVEIRPYLGDWIFGCDICQMVCPWNVRFSGDGYHAFAPTSDRHIPEVIKDLSITSAEFKQKYHNRPLLRAKLTGYLRNLAVAAGNHGNQTYLPEMTGILDNVTDIMVREHLQWAIERSRQPVRSGSVSGNHLEIP